MLNPKKYLQEATSEMRHVQWPTKHHTIRISIITGIFILVSALFITLIDFFIGQATSFVHKKDAVKYQINSPVTIDPSNITAVDANGNAVPLKVNATNDSVTISPPATENNAVNTPTETSTPNLSLDTPLQ